MALNNSLAAEQELLLLKNDICGLNEVYQDLANEIGIENTLVIYNLYHGMQVSFPKSLFSTEHIHNCIATEYNGKNVPQLAQKYNYSERTIWRILKSQNCLTEKAKK
ncbi:MAG: Mor transcription activator family protein [Eubacteriales bacterium]|nr:Mor transcription activator family protein [Eubacteriales bacterium]